MHFLGGFYFGDVFYEICEYILVLLVFCVYWFDGVVFFPFLLFGFMR